ncbi:MAG: class I SAM-dependent methyltransferase [Sphingobacteriales bacterium]|nr:MAG: class I SAM-dependent methyltransferase [Sphingobacteriales bacterium]
MRKKADNFFSAFPDNSAEQHIYKGIEAFFGEPRYAKDKKYLYEIDVLRKKLAQDSSILQRTDFGAGVTSKLYKPVNKTTVAKLHKGSSMPQPLAMFLFEIIRHTKPVNCLELGTCLGISGSYIAGALQLNGKGKLVTLEGDKNSAAIAKGNFAKLKLAENTTIVTGKFADTLPEVLLNLGHVDFALIDGHHNGAATLQYYEQIKPYLSEKAILVFDDIDWSSDMQNAWLKLQQNKELYLFLDLGRMGICVYSKSSLPKAQLYLPV